MWLSFCVSILLLIRHKVFSGATILIAGLLFQNYFIVAGGVIWTIVGIIALIHKNKKEEKQEYQRKVIEAQLKMIEQESSVKLEQYDAQIAFHYCLFCGGECFVYGGVGDRQEYRCGRCHKRQRSVEQRGIERKCLACGGKCFVYSHASGALAYMCLVCSKRFRHTDYKDDK